MLCHELIVKSCGNLAAAVIFLFKVTKIAIFAALTTIDTNIQESQTLQWSDMRNKIIGLVGFRKRPLSP